MEEQDLARHNGGSAAAVCLDGHQSGVEGPENGKAEQGAVAVVRGEDEQAGPLRQQAAAGWMPYPLPLLTHFLWHMLVSVRLAPLQSKRAWLLPGLIYIHLRLECLY